MGQKGQETKFLFISDIPVHSVRFFRVTHPDRVPLPANLDLDNDFVRETGKTLTDFTVCFRMSIDFVVSLHPPPLLELERVSEPARRPGPEEKLAVNKPSIRDYPSLILVETRNSMIPPNQARI